jgi:hypothetical protein
MVLSFFLKAALCKVKIKKNIPEKMIKLNNSELKMLE